MEIIEHSRLLMNYTLEDRLKERADRGIWSISCLGHIWNYDYDRIIIFIFSG